MPTNSLSVRASQLIGWLHKTFPSLPHCIRTRTPSCLKTGICIGQILTQILPNIYTKSLLSQIEVNKSNLNTETCINNLNQCLQCVKEFITIEMNDMGILVDGFTAEGLYYRETDMIKFVLSPIKSICEYKITTETQLPPITTYSNTVSAHLVPAHSTSHIYHKTNTNMNMSQLSDIANMSSIQNHHIPISNNPKNNQNRINTKRNNNMFNINTTNETLSNAPACDTQFYQENEQYESGNQGEAAQQENLFEKEDIELISQQQIELLQNWLVSKQIFSTQPHQILGSLVNNIFSSYRWSPAIIKQAHFSHGALYIYKKALQFLATSPQTQKLGKMNIMAMIKGIQQYGVVYEGQFWMVVKELYLFEVMRGRWQAVKMDQKSREKSVSRNEMNTRRSGCKQYVDEVQKQNVQKYSNIQKYPSTKSIPKTKTSIPPQQSYAYTVSSLKQSQHWISTVLGYEHSLHKSKDISIHFHKNPILNGTLVSSIIMRLKIGKPSIVKFVNNDTEFKKNWEEIGRVCAHRGYESLKEIIRSLIGNVNHEKMKTQLVNYVLANLISLKKEYQSKNPKNESPKSVKQLKHKTSKVPQSKCLIRTHQDKSELLRWLHENFSVQIPQNTNFTLTNANLTQICQEMLDIKLHKQTTPQILINNIQKILSELRRIGLTEYYSITKEIVMSSEDTSRWKILNDLKWLIDGKIHFQTS